MVEETDIYACMCARFASKEKIKQTAENIIVGTKLAHVPRG